MLTRLAAVAAAVALLSGACGTSPASPSATPHVRPSPAASETAAPSTASSSSATPSGDPRFASFTPCAPAPGIGAPGWLCGTLEVPLDRADPSAGTIPIAIKVLPHTDLSSPADEPLFTTPGGPGYPGFDNYGLWPMQSELLPHHDIVTIDPRGTGDSNVIDCPDLQKGASGIDKLQTAVAACAAQLGVAADRYGAADVALDLEAVRQLLGYPKIDYYGGSYGSVDAQAYVVRFPNRVRALVFDSGFSVAAGPGYSNFFGTGSPQALIEIAVRQCQRNSNCKALVADPQAALRAVIREVQAKPVSGRPDGAAASSPPVVVDEAALANLFVGADPVALVLASEALLAHDSKPLLGLASAPLDLSNGSVADFSAGTNAAGSCNDADARWHRTDPIPVRRQKLAAAIRALPADAFAPFSTVAWTATIPFAMCIPWPAPNRFEPVVQPGAAFPDVPTLLLSGDADGNIPTFVSRVLLGSFPDAHLVVIAGAGHQTLSDPQPCAANIASHFLETLMLGDTSCASAGP